MKEKQKKYAKYGGITLLILAVIVTAIFLLYEKGEGEPGLKEIISDKSKAYETDLIDSINSMGSNEDVAKYLENWGKNKSIKTIRDKANNVIFSFKGNKELKNESPVVIVCGFDYSNMELYKNQIVTALTVSKAKQEHKRFIVIFTPEEMGSKVGIDALNKRYFVKNGDIIFLDDTYSAKLSTITGGFKSIYLKKKIKYKDSKYDKAYKIYIKNIPVNIYHEAQDTLNPIKHLGVVLANFKSNNLLFELADFGGGMVGRLTPDGAEMTVLVNETDEEKFKEKLDGLVDKLNEKYIEDYPEITYGYEEVKRPNKVISQHDTEKIISLMYTTPNGNYYKDDSGNVVALSNMESLKIKDGRIQINIGIHSYDEMYLEEMMDTYQVISGLTNFKLRVIHEGEIGEENEKDIETAGKFTDAFKEFSDGKELNNLPTVRFQPKNYIRSINSDSSILCFNISTKSRDNFIGGLITYLSKAEEEKN